MSHFSRKSYTTVKKQLQADAGFSTDVLSTMDTTFMFSYAIGSFFSGSLGDRMRPSTVVAAGLWGSAICVAVLCVAIWTDFMVEAPGVGDAAVLFTWLIHGLFQSTGGPVNTAIMGGWFGAKNRGLIFGTWTCHQYIGNIMAAVVSMLILNSTLPYWWALMVPAVANFGWGCVCYALPSRPAEAGIEYGDAPKKSANTDEKDQPPPISFGAAIRIPAVAMYAIAFGFFKLVNYVIFFWLPFFLARSFSPAQANIISSLYDIGMMPGGIIVGFVSDLYGGRRACVIVSMLSFLCPLLWRRREENVRFRGLRRADRGSQGGWSSGDEARTPPPPRPRFAIDRLTSHTAVVVVVRLTTTTTTETTTETVEEERIREEEEDPKLTHGSGRVGGQRRLLRVVVMAVEVVVPRAVGARPFVAARRGPSVAPVVVAMAASASRPSGRPSKRYQAKTFGGAWLLLQGSPLRSHAGICPPRRRSATPHFIGF